MATDTTPAARLTIELGTSTGSVVWTIEAKAHATAHGAFDLSVQHKDGGYSQHPGHPLGNEGLESGLRLALRNASGYMVLSDSSGRMEEGTRL